eukprot:CAMPEP_0176121344 /NCGR_PEP_ID=MMETSP0120_2-20121206/61073_1 /TAXON_ID=160619 /ORGANISM="Kryptoperidinium foliaceum, Strain CCMP 1326" /LENGTH=80 /DNA_ID=CAMNT_0017455879 /DNA_START=59 /DNA_END=298 /DNA_ORIENTATION=+
MAAPPSLGVQASKALRATLRLGEDAVEASARCSRDLATLISREALLPAPHSSWRGIQWLGLRSPQCAEARRCNVAADRAA